MVIKVKLLESNKIELINIRVEICRDTNRIRTLGQLTQNILSRYFNHYKLFRAWFTAKITITPSFSAKIFTLDLVWLASYIFAKKNLSFLLLFYSCRLYKTHMLVHSQRGKLKYRDERKSQKNLSQPLFSLVYSNLIAFKSKLPKILCSNWAVVWLDKSISMHSKILSSMCRSLFHPKTFFCRPMKNVF